MIKMQCIDCMNYNAVVSSCAVYGGSIPIEIIVALQKNETNEFSIDGVCREYAQFLKVVDDE